MMLRFHLLGSPFSVIRFPGGFQRPRVCTECGHRSGSARITLQRAPQHKYHRHTAEKDQPAHCSTATKAIVWNNHQLTKKGSKLIVFWIIFPRKIAANVCGKPDRKNSAHIRTQTLVLAATDTTFPWHTLQKLLSKWHAQYLQCYNRSTIPVLTSDVYFSRKGKHRALFALCRSKEEFPTVFLTFTASDTCDNISSDPKAAEGKGRMLRTPLRSSCAPKAPSSDKYRKNPRKKQKEEACW